MSNFHVNAAGEPGKCTAQIACPFGSDENHYPTPELARQAYEDANAEVTVPKASKKISNWLKAGNAKKGSVISPKDYDNREFDHLAYDQVTFDEDHQMKRIERIVNHKYQKRSKEERNEIVQKMLDRTRGDWYREAEFEPVVSFQREAPARLIPRGVEIMGDDGNGGRKVIGVMDYPDTDDYGNFPVSYTDTEGNRQWVGPNHPLDVGEVPEADPNAEEHEDPWEREQVHAIRLSTNRAKFAQMERAIALKNQS